MDKHKLIAHITDTISLFADIRQYILVVRETPTQEMRNGYHTYHSTIGSAFEEILTYTTKLNLADGKDKSIKEMASIMEEIVKETRILFKAFEELAIARKG